MIASLVQRGPNQEYVLDAVMGISYEYMEEHNDVATYILPIFRWGNASGKVIISADEIVGMTVPRMVLIDRYVTALKKFNELAATQDHQYWVNNQKLPDEDKHEWISYAKH